MLASLLEVAPIRINTATMVRETDKLNASFSMNKIQKYRVDRKKRSGDFQLREGLARAPQEPAGTSTAKQLPGKEE